MKLIAFVIAIAFLVASIPFGIMTGLPVRAYFGFHHTPPAQNQAAFSMGIIPLANSDFSDDTVSRFNSSVSGWTQIGSSAGVVSGALNLWEFNDFQDEVQHFPAGTPTFMQTSPPSTGRVGNVLVVANNTQNGQAMSGFQSSEFELYADGYFLISFDFFALSSVNAAYLMNGQEVLAQMPLRQVSQEGLQNASLWRTASFFIRTDTRQSLSLSLTLNLGTQSNASQGVVYFDNVLVESLNNAQFHSRLSLRQNPNSNMFRHNLVHEDLRDPENFGEDFDILLEDFVRNRPLAGGTNMRMIQSASAWQHLHFEDQSWMHSYTSEASREVMLLSAINANASMRWNQEFTVERNLLYMLSFYSLSNGPASLRIHDPRTLQDDLPEHIEPFDSGYLPIGQEGSFSRNNWALNTFFISGAALSDINTRIEFWIGEYGQEGNTGWLMVDGISLVRVSNEYFEESSEHINTHIISLRRATGEGIINNPEFNIGTVRSAQNPYPLVAQGWEINTPYENLTLTGIVNTQNWHQFAPFGSARNPGAIPGGPGGMQHNINNNIFMIQNRIGTTQRVYSNSFVLAPGQWNIISFDLARQVSSNANISAVLEIDGSEELLLNLNTATSIGWRNFSMAIQVSQFSSTNARLVFNVQNSLGFVACFIDNVQVRTDIARPSSVSVFTDMENLVNAADFVETMPSDEPQVLTYLRRDWLEITTSGPPQIASVRNSHTLTLDGPAFFRYTMEINITEFEYSVVQQWVDGELQDDPGDDFEFGVSFSFDGFDGEFANLQHGDLGTEWITLVFYLRTTSEQNLNLNISFGNEWRRVRAELLIREISLERVEQEDWDDATDDFEQGSALFTQAGIQDDGPGDEPIERPGGPGFDWIMVSTIILAVTVIFALAMVLLRKLKFNRHMGKRHTTYAKDDAGVKGAKTSIDDLIAKGDNVSLDDDDL